jgi:hypothetical protein
MLKRDREGKRNMLNKIINVILRSNQPRGFQAYVNRVQKGSKISGPTYDEARKDYQGISPYA